MARIRQPAAVPVFKQPVQPQPQTPQSTMMTTTATATQGMGTVLDTIMEKAYGSDAIVKKQEVFPGLKIPFEIHEDMRPLYIHLYAPKQGDDVIAAANILKKDILYMIQRMQVSFTVSKYHEELYSQFDMAVSLLHTWSPTPRHRRRHSFSHSSRLQARSYG